MAPGANGCKRLFPGWDLVAAAWADTISRTYPAPYARKARGVARDLLQTVPDFDDCHLFYGVPPPGINEQYIIGFKDDRSNSIVSWCCFAMTNILRDVGETYQMDGVLPREEMAFYAS